MEEPFFSVFPHYLTAYPMDYPRNLRRRTVSEAFGRWWNSGPVRPRGAFKRFPATPFRRRRYRRRYRRRSTKRRYRRRSRASKYRSLKRVRALGMNGRYRRFPSANPNNGIGTFRINGVCYDGADAGTPASIGQVIGFYGDTTTGPGVTLNEYWYALSVPLIPFRCNQATASDNYSIIYSNGTVPTISVSAGTALANSRQLWNYDELNAFREIRCEWVTYTITLVENLHVVPTADATLYTQTPVLEIRYVNFDANPWRLPNGGVSCGSTDRITWDHTFKGQSNYNKLIKKIKIPYQAIAEPAASTYVAKDRTRTHVFKITIKNPMKQLKEMYHDGSADVDPDFLSKDGFCARDWWETANYAVSHLGARYAPHRGIVFKLNHYHEDGTYQNDVEGNLWIQRVSLNSQWSGRGAIIGDRGY